MLEKLVSSSDQILPTTGFWGFLLQNWVAIAVVVMVLGFVTDQLLYVVRYRPQDELRRKYYAFRRFLTHRFGVKPALEPTPRGDAAPRRNKLEDSGITVRKRDEEEVFTPTPHGARDAAEPVIRRAEAIYRPGGPAAPRQQERAFDEDAPLVHRNAGAERPQAQSAAPRVPARQAPRGYEPGANAPQRAREPSVRQEPARRQSQANVPPGARPARGEGAAPRPAPRGVQLEEAQEDGDAPMIVRAPGEAAKRRDEEPITIRPNQRSE